MGFDSGDLEMLAELARRHGEMAPEGAGNASRRDEPKTMGDAIDTVLATAERLTGGIQSGGRHECSRSHAGFSGETTGEMPWTHGDTRRQGLHRQALIEMIQYPVLQCPDLAGRRFLGLQRRAELSLAATAAHVEDEFARQSLSEIGTVIFFDQVQSKIEPAADPGRTVEFTVAEINRIALNRDGGLTSRPGCATTP